MVTTGAVGEQYWDEQEMDEMDEVAIIPNPACDCYEKCLWYLCCGSSEWEAAVS